MSGAGKVVGGILRQRPCSFRMVADRSLPPVRELGPHGTISVAHHLLGIVATRGGWLSVRKLIAFDEELSTS